MEKLVIVKKKDKKAEGKGYRRREAGNQSLTRGIERQTKDTQTKAEHLKQKRKRNERVREGAFQRDLFKFVKGLFSQEKGQLKSPKLEAEDYLRLDVLSF